MFALITISEKMGMGMSDSDIAGEVEKVGGGNPGKNAVRTMGSP